MQNVNEITSVGGNSYLIGMPIDHIPAAAIFDCDGTLADTMPLHYRAWSEALASHDTPFPEELFYEWGGVTTHEIIERLNLRYGTALVAANIAHQKEAIYQKLIPQVRPIEVVIAEMERLHGKCPLAVASGGIRPLITRTLETLNIAHYFDAMVTAEDVRRGKPAPDTFLLAAERLGVDPTACVVYEDSPTGLEAAQRAGMKAVDIRPYVLKEQ